MTWRSSNYERIAPFLQHDSANSLDGSAGGQIGGVNGIGSAQRIAIYPTSSGGGHLIQPGKVLLRMDLRDQTAISWRERRQWTIHQQSFTFQVRPDCSNPGGLLDVRTSVMT
jgi:hypothetical protein